MSDEVSELKKRIAELQKLLSDALAEVQDKYDRRSVETANSNCTLGATTHNAMIEGRGECPGCNKPTPPEFAENQYFCFVEGCPGNHPGKYGVCASPPPTGWQPMETAPKDGRPILVGHPGFTCPWVVFWVYENEPADGRWFLSNSPTGECSHTKPTHWLPVTHPGELVLEPRDCLTCDGTGAILVGTLPDDVSEQKCTDCNGEGELSGRETGDSRG